MALCNLLCLLVVALLSSSVRCSLPSTAFLRQIYTFPPNHFIENIAVRSNGHILLTSMSVNTLYTLDPTVASPSVSVLHTFPEGHGLMGITELSHDLFVLVSGIWDLPTTRASLGTLTVWTINLNHATPITTNITTISTSIQLNGLASIPNSRNLILAADADAGCVYRINVSTGAYSVAFSDPLFKPTVAGQNLGINGIRTRGSYLYFASSAQQYYGRVRINSIGNKIDPVKVISNNTIAGSGGFPSAYDDFALDRDDNAWTATHPSHVVKVSLGGQQTVVKNETLLLNPTSAQFGRGSRKERETLYVTNGGEFLADFTLVNGGIVALDTTQV